MKYALAEIELTNPGSVSIAADESGAGILVRHRDLPVAFFMIETSPGIIEGDELRSLLMTAAGTDIARALVREELSPPPAGLDTPIPTVTVAVCTRDHPDHVARVISSVLAAASYAGAAGTLDLLVVDNAPSDQRTRQVAESFSGVRYVCEPKPGLDFGRNLAIEAATGEILAYVDDDAVVDRCWLAALTGASRQNPEAAAFTGPVLPYELETTAQILFEQGGGFGRKFRWQRYGPDSLDVHNYPCNAGMFGAGCNMSFRRSALIDLGGFDEALDTGAPLPGGGDLDIFFRVLRAGLTLIYEPRLVVRHQHRREYAALRRQMYTWGLGTMAYATKNYRSNPALQPRFRCMILGWYRTLAGKGIRSLARGGAGSPALVLAELWGAIVGTCGEYGRSQRRIERIRRQFT